VIEGERGERRETEREIENIRNINNIERSNAGKERDETEREIKTLKQKEKDKDRVVDTRKRENSLKSFMLVHALLYSNHDDM
jgi:hypothetical protein